MHGTLKEYENDIVSLLIANPVDTGRKLNVLCTFNLRPVSTEK